MVISQSQLAHEWFVFHGEDNPDLLKQIETFRVSTWSTSIGAEQAARRFGRDIFDERSWHIACFDKAELIACGRLSIAATESHIPDTCSFEPYYTTMDFPIGMLNRLVVHHRYRRAGLANRINRERLVLANFQGATDLWVEVRACRTRSMNRLGFVDVGPSLDKSVPGNWRIMRRRT